jgi:hypothetical protein
MKITKLKGGSLSSTCLYESPDVSFVRKSVSTVKDREYGFVRWYSQLKKLQRYQTLFPNLVPRILNVGYNKDTAYFDLEYLRDYQDIKIILSSNSVEYSTIKNINTALWSAFAVLHSNRYTANPSAGVLYYKEEVLQKLVDANTVNEFQEFYNLESYFYNGKYVPGIQNHLNRLEEFFRNLNLSSEEYTHGNPTLENTMYSPSENRIVFIDLYEESIVDSKFLDYSQVLQCSNSLYGYINDRQVIIEGNAVSHSLTIPDSFKEFNQLFEQGIDPSDRAVVDIFEATQFIRMLPFKCFAGDINKAKFFYVHACYLLDKILGQ